MPLPDEFRTLRRRQDEVRDLIDRNPRGSSGTAKFVGRVYNAGAMPGTVPGQFAVHPVTISGTESEGSATGATTDSGHTRVVTVLGPRLPVVNDLLTARLIGGRWVAGLGGGGMSTPSHPMPGCPCATVPDSLTMTCAIEPTNGTNSVVFPATITYGPKPADVAAYPGNNPGWWSTSAFTSINGFYVVRYVFGCAGGLYFVKATTTSSSPFPVPEWAIMTWSIGGLRTNTCSPFLMNDGAWHFPEGQNDQGVTIHG